MLINLIEDQQIQDISRAPKKIRNTPIFRIYPIDRLVELFTEKKNTLVKPSMWADPYENPLFRKTFEAPNGTLGCNNVTKNFFAQCWSLHAQTDAMWRIYSPNNGGVKVRTTIEKLFNSLVEKAPEKGRVFIGKVEYKKKEKYEESIKKTMSIGAQEPDLARSLLIKRYEFSHEREIRLLYDHNRDIKDETYAYEFDPLEVIDQIMFDPRLQESMVEVYKNFFKKQGFQKIMKKSELYTYKPEA